jgi:4-hydroxybenzoate polyprenyltransferase
MSNDMRPSIWDRFPALKPYAQLARWDRPIGIWLLYWPCVWSLGLARQFHAMNAWERITILALFFIGAVAMRGAGCVVNDIWDRKLDAQVARTRDRPLASGTISLPQAVLFLVLQLLIGATVLFQLSPLAVMLGLATLPLIALYPYLKRITWWPQIFLGLVFNTGTLIGWAALENTINTVPVLLYIAGFFWTMAYDTVYAHLDAEDDQLIGIKSTALRFGVDSKFYVGGFWFAAGLFFIFALMADGATRTAYVMAILAGLIETTAHILWQPANQRYTLAFFRFQAQIGLLLALACLAPALF